MDLSKVTFDKALEFLNDEKYKLMYTPLNINKTLQYKVLYLAASELYENTEYYNDIEYYYETYSDIDSAMSMIGCIFLWWTIYCNWIF
jgi:hypothetical protein